MIFIQFLSKGKRRALRSATLSRQIIITGRLTDVNYLASILAMGSAVSEQVIMGVFILIITDTGNLSTLQTRRLFDIPWESEGTNKDPFNHGP